MQIITLPGFTAEVSLYKASGLRFQNTALARQYGSNNTTLVYPAASCSICGPCEDAGGICIYTRHGCYCV